MEQSPEEIADCMPEEKVTFTPQKMVGWYNAEQLINTGIKSVVSSVFGDYADKRETQAAIAHSEGHDYSEKYKEIWFDFTADLGDGFNSTYTIARLLAKESLTLTNTNSEIVTKRGNILILGGDQVYPVASRKNYNNKLIGPYATAFPKNNDDTNPPHLYAVPGNHDWYDGLTHFLKIFCQQRSLGNWRTQQHRSYFSIKLSEKVWLWGIDIQLNTDIDKPQLDYFDTIAAKMNEGDNVILCTAEPSWIYTTKPKDPSYHNLKFFEEEYIVKKKFQLILSLSGDLHHYARYSKKEENQELHKLTTGGGGAFSHPTHNLPDQICVREGYFNFRTSFPSKKESRRMTFWNLLYPITNWSFACFMGAFYLLFAWMLQSYTRNDNATFIQNLSDHAPSVSNLNWFMHLAGDVIMMSPFLVVLMALIIFGLYAFADTDSGNVGWAKLAGILHGIAHMIINFLLLWIFAYINQQFLHIPLATFMGVLLLSLEMFLIGGGIGSMIMAGYLMFCNLILHTHDNEAFSALKWQDHKSFLRMHLTQDQLTIYPIGVRRVTRWKRVGNLFKGQDAETHLIEEPIKINLTTINQEPYEISVIENYRH